MGSTGAVEREYLYLDQEPVALVEGGEVYYFLNSKLGAPQLLVNSKQQVMWEADYAPFGEVTIKTQKLTQNIRFPGQYYDAETGLHYNWHRYYDPALGRYLQPDPIGLAGGTDLYAYVGNNPLRWVDPEGLFDIPSYTQWMHDHAHSSSQGQCAKYVRRGLEAGGADTRGHPIAAKDYGPILEKNGFTLITGSNYIDKIPAKFQNSGDTILN